MPRGEKLFRFLSGLMLKRFCGTAIIRFEAGKVTHVEIESRRTWRYKELAEQEGALGSTYDGGRDEPGAGSGA